MKTTLINQPDITRRHAIKGGIGAASLAALGTGAAVPVTIPTASVAAPTDTAQAQLPSASAMPSNITQPARAS